MQTFARYELGYSTPADPRLQGELESIDRRLREQFGMGTNETAVGLLDLRTLRLAMINPDREEYAASIPKIGILLAYFAINSHAVTNLPPEIRHQLGLMVKASSNEAAAMFSEELGLTNIQAALNSHGFYDAARGGGIWVGKHYGKGGERYGSPAGDNSHAATVRQLLRFYLLLAQRKLISREASALMSDIFASPAIPHDRIKFIKGLEGEPVEVIRKWGSWENWLHDSAVVKGADHHYILVALTRHPRGDEYLEGLARAVYSALGRTPRPNDAGTISGRGQGDLKYRM